ncbi:TPA: Rha family transcriptional regulator [Burkholderia vietnamiensis]|nr:Rha family transcriptional regulator [Burkholderia vietnamiensis]
MNTLSTARPDVRTNLTAGLEAIDGLVRVRDGEPVVDSLTIAREFGRQHAHVLRTLDSLIADGTLGQSNFGSTDYRDAQGKPRRMIELDERAALISMPFIGGRRSREGQVRLVDAFMRLRVQLRSANTAAASAPVPTMQQEKSPTGDLALVESYARLLNVAPSGRIALLRQVAQNYGLDVGLLPAYVVDAPSDAMAGSSEPTAAISKLLKEHRVSMGATAFNILLERGGFLMKRSRKTTQKRYAGGSKHFWSVTPAGTAYGKNVTDPCSPRETQPHWFVSRFPELLSNLRPVYRKLHAEGVL